MLQIKSYGSWSSIAKVYAKVNGTWKKASKAYTKTNGIWKEIDLLPVYRVYEENSEHGSFDGNSWSGFSRYLSFDNEYIEAGSEFYVQFSEPPLQGYGSEKDCYIWNLDSYYLLADAHKIDSGRHKITFTGQIFTVTG